MFFVIRTLIIGGTLPLFLQYYHEDVSDIFKTHALGNSSISEETTPITCGVFVITGLCL